MIGILRFVGVANAAVWFGAAVFYTVAAAPALTSTGTRAILGDTNFPFFGGAISELLRVRYFHFHLICACVAMLHLGLEWLYQGRAPKRLWTALLLVLFWLSLLGSLWLGPKLQELQRTRHLVNVPPPQREQAIRSFRIWEGAFQICNVILLAGAAGYLWRSAHPPDELRFVGTPKFRS